MSRRRLPAGREERGVVGADGGGVRVERERPLVLGARLVAASQAAELVRDVAVQERAVRSRRLGATEPRDRLPETPGPEVELGDVQERQEERRRVLVHRDELLLVESVITPGNEPSFTKLLDLTMLVIPGGKERTEAEYRTLLAAAGFELKRIVPTASEISVIEAAKR